MKIINISLPDALYERLIADLGSMYSTSETPEALLATIFCDKVRSEIREAAALRADGEVCDQAYEIRVSL